MKNEFENISIGRNNENLCKIVSSENFSAELLLNSDLISFIPELRDLIGFQQNNPHHIYDVFGHTVCAIEKCESNDIIIKLALFFHDFGKPCTCQEDENGIRHFRGHAKVSAEIADAIMQRLNFDKEIITKVVELVKYHDATFGEKKNIKKWIRKLGLEQFRRLLEIERCDILAKNPKYIEEKLCAVKNTERILEEILQEEAGH